MAHKAFEGPPAQNGVAAPREAPPPPAKKPSDDGHLTEKETRATGAACALLQPLLIGPCGSSCIEDHSCSFGCQNERKFLSWACKSSFIDALLESSWGVHLRAALIDVEQGPACLSCSFSRRSRQCYQPCRVVQDVCTPKRLPSLSSVEVQQAFSRPSLSRALSWIKQFSALSRAWHDT